MNAKATYIAILIIGSIGSSQHQVLSNAHKLEQQKSLSEKPRKRNAKWTAENYSKYGGFWGKVFQSVYEAAASSTNPNTEATRKDLLKFMERTDNLGTLVDHLDIYAKNWGKDGQNFLGDAHDNYVQVAVGILESLPSLKNLNLSDLNETRKLFNFDKLSNTLYSAAVEELADYLIRADPFHLTRHQTNKQKIYGELTSQANARYQKAKDLLAKEIRSIISDPKQLTETINSESEIRDKQYGEKVKKLLTEESECKTERDKYLQDAKSCTDKSSSLRVDAISYRRTAATLSSKAKSSETHLNSTERRLVYPGHYHIIEMVNPSYWRIVPCEYFSKGIEPNEVGHEWPYVGWEGSVHLGPGREGRWVPASSYDEKSTAITQSREDQGNTKQFKQDIEKAQDNAEALMQKAESLEREARILIEKAESYHCENITSELNQEIGERGDSQKRYDAAKKELSEVEKLWNELSSYLLELNRVELNVYAECARENGNVEISKSIKNSNVQYDLLLKQLKAIESLHGPLVQSYYPGDPVSLWVSAEKESKQIHIQTKGKKK